MILLQRPMYSPALEVLSIFTVVLHLHRLNPVNLYPETDRDLTSNWKESLPLAVCQHFRDLDKQICRKSLSLI